MKSNKLLALFLTLILCFSVMTGTAALAENKKLNVVTTIFPIYDWVREIIGNRDNTEITMLLDKGVDLHSYQPTAQDIMKVATCDVFIYVGGESDEWVEDALKEAVNPSMIVINLVEAMGENIKMEEIVEGMEHEQDHDGEHDEDHDHEEEHEHDEDHDHEEGHDHEEDHDHDHEHDEPDEHVWLSLRNAQILVGSIADGLCTADPEHAETYKANKASYSEKLAVLDEQYAETVQGSAYKTILFGDRFPFRYLADDYNLTYYAAFSGCSAESEASFETIIFLAQKIDELGLPAILTIENPKTRIAQTVVEANGAKDQKILSLDSMQGTTMADVNAGSTYLSVMENNLSILREALNK